MNNPLPLHEVSLTLMMPMIEATARTLPAAKRSMAPPAKIQAE